MAASDTTNSLLMQYMNSMANLGGRNNPTEKMQNYDVQSVLEDIPSWDKDSKYPPDIMDAILNKDYNPDQSFIDTAIGASFKPAIGKMVGKVPATAGKMLGKKAGAKLLTKLGTRMIPGLGWGLAAADMIDYFGVPIYDYMPGGEYMTWRDTTEGEQ